MDELLVLREDNLVAVEEKLTKKGWNYDGGGESDRSGFETATFTYDKSNNDNKATSSITYSSHEDWNRINIYVTKKDLYDTYLGRIESLGGKLIKSNISNGDIEKIYKASELVFKVTTSNDAISGNTVYNILILEYGDYRTNFDPEYDAEGFPYIYQSQKTTNAYNHREAGITMIENKDFEGAIQEFNKSIKLVKNDGGWTYAYRGLSKYKMKDFTGARQDIEKAQELNTMSKIMLSVVSLDASNAIEANNYLKAITCYDLIILLDEKIKSGYTAVTYYHRGMAYWHLNQFKSACSDFAISAELGYKSAEIAVKEKCK